VIPPLAHEAYRHSRPPGWRCPGCSKRTA